MQSAPSAPYPHNKYVQNNTGLRIGKGQTKL